ncbi:MAG: hypothetical protein ACYCSN_20825 [Acidobacteriaceae bacterium]
MNAMPNINAKQISRPASVIAAIFLLCLLAGCGGGHAAIAQATASLSPNQTEVNGITIPPDPGPQNDDTLAWIDTTGSGVRDDVYRAIAAKYGANKVEWKAQMQSAQADQLSVLANGDPTLSNQANQAEMFSGTCVADAFGTDVYKPGVHPISFVFAITNDTPERLAAFESTEAVNTPDVDTPSNGSCK